MKNVKKLTDFEKLKEIRKTFIGDPNIRIYPDGTFYIGCENKIYMIENYRGTKLFDFSDYKDQNHKGKQGRGFVVWKNSDFEEKFNFYPSDICRMNNFKMSKKEFESIMSEADSYGSVLSKKYTDIYD